MERLAIAAIAAIAVAIGSAGCSKKRKAEPRDSPAAVERAKAPEARRAATRTIEAAPPEVKSVTVEPALSALSHHLTGKAFAEAIVPGRKTDLGAPFEVPEDAHIYASIINPDDEVAAWANRNRVVLQLPCERRLPRELERLACVGQAMRIAEVVKVSKLRWLEIANYEIGREHIAKLERLPNLRELSLIGCDLSDDAMEPLTRLPGLTHLRLADNPVTDAAMIHLAQLTNLERLDLSRTQLTNGGLAILAELDKLRFVDLSHTEVTDDGLAHLAKNPFEQLRLEFTGVKGSAFESLKADRLTALSLRGSWADDAGLSAIAKLGSIEYLWLRGASVTDEGVSQLAKLANLRILDLGNTGVRGMAVESIAGLPIEELNLSRLPIGDRVAADLRPMTRLRVLKMVRTRLTSDGIDSITLLPSLEDLWIQKTEVGDSGAAKLVGHPRLEKLRPLGSRMTSDGCETLEASGIKCAFNR